MKHLGQGVVSNVSVPAHIRDQLICFIVFSFSSRPVADIWKGYAFAANMKISVSKFRITNDGM